MVNILNDDVDHEKEDRKIKVIRAQQPIGDLFVSVLDAELIQRTTFFDVRRIEREEREFERYLGIQRPLDRRRVENLEKYVKFTDATFPTSIILSVDEEYAKYNENDSTITLSNYKVNEDKPSISFKSLFRVLDGQHRIAGLKGVSHGAFDVPVTIFIGADIADQAYVFATVNLEQNKVNKSLAIDLYELARVRSPYKTCHNIVVALDSKQGSPFYRRIKRLGVATEGRSGETLTQATVVGGIMPYVSDDPSADRDALLRGKSLPPIQGKDSARLCLRNLFIANEDAKIAKIIENYFLAVEQRWPQAWKNVGPGMILNRTNGYRALMRVFGQFYNHITTPGNLVEARNFLEILGRIELRDADFTPENFPPGSSGESELRKRFVKAIDGGLLL